MKRTHALHSGRHRRCHYSQHSLLALACLIAFAACAPSAPHVPVLEATSAYTPPPTIKQPPSPEPLQPPSGVIGFEQFENQAIYLLDLSSGTFKAVEPLTPSLVDIVGKAIDGCGIIVGPPHSDTGELVEYDLHGDLVAILALYAWNALDGSWVERLIVSPDNARIAYVAGRARPNSDSQLQPDAQDLFVASISSPNTAIPVSRHGGSWTMAWSPDGTRIAFDDLDGKGVPQLYVASFDPIQILQLTDLGSDTQAVKFITWSPDASRLAFSVSTTDDSQQAICLFTVPLLLSNGHTQAPPSRVLPTAEIRITSLSEVWWLEEGDLAVVADIELSGKPESGVFQLSAEGHGIQLTLLPLSYPHPIPRPLEAYLGYFDDESRFTVVEPLTGAQAAQYPSPVDFPVDWLLLSPRDPQHSYCQ